MTSKSRILLQFCFLLLAGACCLSAQTKNPADLAPGKILVATRHGTDGLFAKSVILLLRYDHTGALGLMVNRQTKMPISRALSELKVAEGHSDPIFVGGPVELGTVFALARAKSKPEGASTVLGDIYFISTKTGLEKALGEVSNSSGLRIYVGYCGWAPNQLEHEVLRGSWYIFNRSEDVAFDAVPATLWSRLISKTERQFVRLNPTPPQHREKVRLQSRRRQLVDWKNWRADL
jgi:putative transcriptional regulator